MKTMFEFISSPTNSMRGTPFSLSTKLTLLVNTEVVGLTRREIVTRAAALMNGEEASGSRARRAAKLWGTMVKGVTLV